jgi:uncharacterized membrane protein YphA (DoxX/SURF4 family)
MLRVADSAACRAHDRPRSGWDVVWFVIRQLPVAAAIISGCVLVAVGVFHPEASFVLVLWSIPTAAAVGQALRAAHRTDT